MLDKKIIRNKNKTIRATLAKSGAIEVISKKIVEKILARDDFINAKNVMIYHPKKGEIDLLALCEFSNKNFYLPRCVEDDMEICIYKPNDKLISNKFNIYEPRNAKEDNLSILDIIFIPAIGADLFGGRIGHGFGYYDRFLKNSQIKAKKIVVLPKELICEKICTDIFDVKYDMLITD